MNGAIYGVFFDEVKLVALYFEAFLMLGDHRSGILLEFEEKLQFAKDRVKR